MAVIIGMDPHKRSATIEIIDSTSKILATGRYGTDNTGYAEILTVAQKYVDRVWAIEGCNGIGRHIAHRLVHDGETVIDVPAKLSAQVRVFATGNGRKTDPVDAHSVALAALRAPDLRRVQPDSELIALGMLADRRDELGRGPHRHRQPVAPTAAGTAGWWGKEIPVGGTSPHTGTSDKPHPGLTTNHNSSDLQPTP
ncbi:transposase [Nocardia suismassiliense]|uniref:Transposase n=1 Tax=Nocardia suismassiliense TaxID=2077092 RepID=A0ABW6QPA8_9NOCA